MFLIDLPASILMLLVTQFVDPLLVFGILGTAWWYLIGRVFVRLLRWVLARGEVPQP